MGEQVEKVAMERKHSIVAYIDSETDWEKQWKNFQKADVAIDFSMPAVVVSNIRHCFSAHMPVVVGTTGWTEALPDIEKQCLEEGQSLFHASNFSLGVNLFFRLNRYLAQLMAPYEAYDVNIEEIHHTSKKDAPSGTAIVLANDIIAMHPHKDSWVGEMNGEQALHHLRGQRSRENDARSGARVHQGQSDGLPFDAHALRRQQPRKQDRHEAGLKRRRSNDVDLRICQRHRV